MDLQDGYSSTAETLNMDTSPLPSLNPSSSSSSWVTLDAPLPPRKYAFFNERSIALDIAEGILVRLKVMHYHMEESQQPLSLMDTSVVEPKDKERREHEFRIRGNHITIFETSKDLDEDLRYNGYGLSIYYPGGASEYTFKKARNWFAHSFRVPDRSDYNPWNELKKEYPIALEKIKVSLEQLESLIADESAWLDEEAFRKIEEEKERRRKEEREKEWKAEAIRHQKIIEQMEEARNPSEDETWVVVETPTPGETSSVHYTSSLQSAATSLLKKSIGKARLYEQKGFNALYNRSKHLQDLIDTAWEEKHRQEQGDEEGSLEEEPWEEQVILTYEVNSGENQGEEPNHSGEELAWS